MTVKKSLRTCAACLALTCVLTVPALAHGHHGGHHGAAVSAAAACPVADCQETGEHSHDGADYCGHTRDDGHAQHGACAVDGCRILRDHTHVTTLHHSCRR